MFSEVNQCKTEYDDAGPCPPLRSFILLPLHCIDARCGRHRRPTASGNSSDTGPQMDLCAIRAGPQCMNEPQTDCCPRKTFVTTLVAREGCVRGVPPLTDLPHFALRGGRIGCAESQALAIVAHDSVTFSIVVQVAPCLSLSCRHFRLNIYENGTGELFFLRFVTNRALGS